MRNIRKSSLICLAVVLALFAAGCAKKTPASAPPPPPPGPSGPTTPSAPTPGVPRIAQFVAEPATIQPGQASTLRWEVTGVAPGVAIDQGIGSVQPTGTQRVTPNASTTYTLTATGPGGSVNARATVTVAAAPPPVAPRPTTSSRPFPERLESELQDAYFDYDKSDVRSDARDTLTRDAAALKSILADFPSASVVVEGHCDERGSAEYNLGLGDRRSTAARDFLVQLGVPADKLKTISYGKERPVCTDANEGCWQKNRRAHFSPGQ